MARFKELYAAPKDQYFAEVFVSNSLAYCELGILGRFSCIWPLKLEYCKTLQQNHDFCKICTRKLHPVTTKPLFFSQMAPHYNKTMVFQGRPSLTSPRFGGGEKSRSCTHFHGNSSILGDLRRQPRNLPKSMVFE